MIDTHAHLDFKDFKNDQSEVIKQAKEIGISHILNIGANLETSKNSIKLAKKYDFVFASIGVHPSDSFELENEDNKKELEKLLQNPKIKAVGEIGLDYYWIGKGNTPNKEVQKKHFIYQLNLAKKYNLPVIIHSRDAKEDTFEIIKKEKPNTAVLHCYSYDLDFAEQFLELNENYMISFTAVLTFPNAKDLKDTAKNIPLSKMMVETDCPFLAPQKYRGKRNEPSYVKEIVQEISDLKNISFENIEKETDKNAKKFFELI